MLGTTARVRHEQPASVVAMSASGLWPMAPEPLHISHHRRGRPRTAAGRRHATGQHADHRSRTAPSPHPHAPYDDASSPRLHPKGVLAPRQGPTRLRHHVVGRVGADAAAHVPLHLRGIPAEQHREMLRLVPGPPDHGRVVLAVTPGGQVRSGAPLAFRYDVGPAMSDGVDQALVPQDGDGPAGGVTGHPERAYEPRL
jgi:hypothetical protein